MKNYILNFLFKAYATLFSRPWLSPVNKLFYILSLNGMGVLNYQNEYLSGEKDFLKGFLKNKTSPVVFDVGANVGNYSNKIITFCPGAIIYAFEPHPETFSKLKANVRIKQFTATNVGVGHEEGTLELFDYVDNDGSSHASLFKEVIEDIHNKSSVSHSVPVITLDKFIESNDIDHIDLLKIDTEGNEFNVLKGLEQTLSKGKVHAVHFEFNEMNIASKVSFKNFWDKLKDFSFYRLLPGGKLLKIKRYDPIMTEIYAYQNIIAIKN